MLGSANLNIMLKAARKAGRSLVKDFREVENLQASMKSAGDFVSKADIAAEKILKEELMGARPTYGWLAEEGGAEEGQDPTRRWIVDPLDGTTNFLHGLPHWAISIGLEHKGQVVAGVVYDAAKDEMFFAEKGEGAWLNDSRLRVSNRAKMIESIFATGVPLGAAPTCRTRCRTSRASCPPARACAAGALRRSTWLMWPPGATKGSGNAASTRGTWPRASSSCAKRAG
jgi:myo-inositol-1(or 4)-monophosphatase